MTSATASLRMAAVAVLCLWVDGVPARAASVPADAPLPAGVKAVWDLDKASHETRPRASGSASTACGAAAGRGRGRRVPTDNWGYFKVPGCWPGIADYMQKDCQTRLRPSELEGREPRRHHRGLVSARDHRPRGMGRPPHRPLRRVPELLRRRLRGRQEGGRDALPGGRGGPHRRLPAGQQARAQPARRRHAAQGRHALLHRHQLRPKRGQGHGRRGAACAATSTWSAARRRRASPT